MRETVNTTSTSKPEALATNASAFLFRLNVYINLDEVRLKVVLDLDESGAYNIGVR